MHTHVQTHISTHTCGAAQTLVHLSSAVTSGGPRGLSLPRPHYAVQHLSSLGFEGESIGGNCVWSSGKRPALSIPCWVSKETHEYFSAFFKVEYFCFSYGLSSLEFWRTCSHHKIRRRNYLSYIWESTWIKPALGSAHISFAFSLLGCY